MEEEDDDDAVEEDGKSTRKHTNARVSNKKEFKNSVGKTTV